MKARLPLMIIATLFCAFVLPKEAGAAVVSTGRSDFPNQINNVLCFPGIFRGALDVRASDINDEMKIAAAKAIASLVLGGMCEE